VYSLVYEAPAILGMWSGYWLFATMLVGLQCLHVFWFALILKMVWKLLSVGNCGSDVRESDDEWDGSDDGAESSVDTKSSGQHSKDS
jgi:ceramide synthetase